jgi:hypothetical protein
MKWLLSFFGTVLNWIEFNKKDQRSGVMQDARCADLPRKAVERFQIDRAKAVQYFPSFAIRWSVHYEARDGGEFCEGIGKFRKRLLDMRHDSIGIATVFYNVDRALIVANVVFVCERPRFLLGGSHKRRYDLFERSKLRGL